MNNKIDLSVVIVNFNTKDLLKNCLESIYKTEWHIDLEVVVVDNNSIDGSGDMVKRMFSQVRLVENKKNLGFSKANNMGAKVSGGDYILFLNPDTEVFDSSLEGMLSALKSSSDVGIIGSQLLFPDGTLQLSCRKFYTLSAVIARRTFLGKLFPFNKIERDHLMSYWDHSTYREVDWLLGACMLIKRELFIKVGCFDEGYRMYFEDVDLCSKVKQLGYKTYYFPKAKILHHHRRDSAHSFSMKTLYHIRSMFRFYRKHRIKINLYKLFRK